MKVRIEVRQDWRRENSEQEVITLGEGKTGRRECNFLAACSYHFDFFLRFTADAVKNVFDQPC